MRKYQKSWKGKEQIAIVKHDPKDKAEFDRVGKDSYRFFESGADVAVVSPNRTTLFFHKTHTLEDIVKLFGDFELLMVEGLKSLPLPRIGIFRGEIDESYLNKVSAIAIDGSIDLSKYSLPKELDILNLKWYLSDN